MFVDGGGLFLFVRVSIVVFVVVVDPCLLMVAACFLLLGFPFSCLLFFARILVNFLKNY